jgi:hypothetical protein
MTRRLALWLALRTIEVVAILVPAAARSDWKRVARGAALPLGTTAAPET